MASISDVGSPGKKKKKDGRKWRRRRGMPPLPQIETNRHRGGEKEGEWGVETLKEPPPPPPKKK